jgi:hypothetical protein
MDSVFQELPKVWGAGGFSDAEKAQLEDVGIPSPLLDKYNADTLGTK